MNYHLVDLYIWNVTWFKNGPIPHNPQKLNLPTRYTTEKSHGLHDIKTDISKLAYHHPRRVFFLAFRTRGWVSGTGLMVYSKRIAIFAVKKTNWSENRSGLRLVSTFCKSLTSLCQNSCLTDQPAQREKENHKINYFLSVLASMTGQINMAYFANESVLTICWLSRPPSLKIYTAAKKVYTISRIRLWLMTKLYQRPVQIQVSKALNSSQWTLCYTSHTIRQHSSVL